MATARPHVIVVSHERSGTHFLMNALARAYDYPQTNFINFDLPHLNINYFDPDAVAGFFLGVAKKAPTSLTKSHHPVDFFGPRLADVAGPYVILYIHRHPVDAMVSFWRFIQSWHWHEGPRTPTPLAFAAAEPEGRMMRYQVRQYPNLLHRWAAHVEGWTRAAETNQRIRVVPYEGLSETYDATLRALEPLLGPCSGSLVRPNRYSNVVAAAPPAPLATADREALDDLARAEVGDTMRHLGYA